MRCLGDTTWVWNTRQDKRYVWFSCLLFLHITQTWARPDFIDTMSSQFFGFSNNGQPQHYPTPDPFMQMFGSASQQVPQTSQSHPQRNYQHINNQQKSPQRQGYYIAPPAAPAHHQAYPHYNGPPAVIGQQQGFGHRPSNPNETNTVGYPPDKDRTHHLHTTHHIQHEGRYPPHAVEYQQPHHHQPQTTVIEYPQHQQVEYHHIPPHTAVVEEHHHPTLQIHSDVDHGHHPPTYVEHHHPPPVEYHHHHEPKPKKFQISFKQSPEYKIVDHHLKIPPVKFRFHLNPKIVITTNTKDPLDKKHHDDEHDLEPYPPPDAFSDPDVPPQYNKHTVELYPVKHHYPVEHAVAPHYEVHPHQQHYPVQHHIEHHPEHGYTYDLSQGHSHLNPHRSLHHYEPTFKVKTKALIITEPPPTRAPTTTTTRRPTTTTRSTTARTTTTSRPSRRARISARNPGFSVAFTESSTTSSTTTASTTSTTTRRSNPDRERENDSSARRGDFPNSPETSNQPSTSKAMQSSTTTLEPISELSSTTTQRSSTVSTTTTPKPTTTATTTSTTTTKPTTTSTTTTTTQPTTTSTTTTTTITTPKPIVTSISTSVTPAEETTRRTTTLSINTNEIDVNKSTEQPRRRPEPLQSSPVERSEPFNLESSESVKVIETTMLIDGKNQTVKFYYITQPVKLPLDVFRKMTGQSKDSAGMNVIKIRDKRSYLFSSNLNDV